MKPSDWHCGGGRDAPARDHVDGHPAYTRAIANLKGTGELGSAASAGPLLITITLWSRTIDSSKSELPRACGSARSKGVEYGRRLRVDAHDQKGASEMAGQG